MNTSVYALKCNIMWLLILICCLQTTPASSLFWEDQIDSALNQKEAYFNSINISLDSVAIQNWDYNKKLSALDALDIAPSLDNPWYHITRGLIDGSLSESNQAIFFNRAFYLAQNSPGTIWLLFFELQRSKFYPWADKCLEQLEKLMLQSGASNCRLISSLLLFLGSDLEKTDKNQAKRIYDWAKKFDSAQNISSVKNAWNNFPFDITTFMTEYKNVLHHLKNSWSSQLQLTLVLYNWLSNFLTLLIFAPLLILIIKYIPYALHKISDLMPYTVPLFLRAPLVTVIYFTFALVNIYALLWSSAFLIWKFLTDQEKKLLTMVLILMVLSPLDSYIQGSLFMAANPQGSLYSFSRAVNEGYSEKQYNEVLLKHTNDGTDYLAALSSAVYELKKQDFESATINIRNASSLCSNDPVFLIAAGNLHFLKNDIEKAETFYRQVLKDNNNNNNAEALFNLAQCQLRKLNTITATEYISDAASIKPGLINEHVHNNEKYFSRNWPPIRQIMFSDFSPYDFWTRHFPYYSFNNKTASLMWSPKFFAIPPIVSTILFAAFLAVIIIFFRNNNDQRRFKKIFECKFCGRIICRKCKSGTLCHSCHEATQFMSNEKSLDKMRKIISEQAKQINQIKYAIAGTVFPGAEQLFMPETSLVKLMLKIMSSSAVYATYISLFRSTNDFHLKPIIILILLLVLPVIYNAYFLWYGIQTAVQGFKKTQETV